MHELQIASDLMNAVMEAVKEHPGASRVEKVHLSIGRLSFVGEEQLRFCWGAITEENPLLKGSELAISVDEVEISCRSCGYTGDMDVREDPMYHYLLPVFACPRCTGEVDIISGKGVMIGNIRLIIDDGVSE